MTLCDLGDGLIQRRATAADTDAVVAFTADVLRHQDAAGPDDQTGAWTRDLMQGRHPTFAPDDFLLVEDRRTGAIVSAVCLISQTWSYGGVPIAVGQPELIGTRAEYRGRGLVRAQLDTVHAWSASRAQELLAIDGIPWFYRQFGYEMALALRGGQSIEAARIAAGGSSYRVREASDADVPFMARTAAASADRYLVACPRDEALWSYELNGHHERSTYAPELRVVETPAGEPIGFLAHLGRLVGGELITVAAELASGKSWRSAAPSVLRYLRSTGEAYAAHEGGSCERLVFWFGDEHPAAPALATLSPRVEQAYAWYLRVPDLPAFLRRVAPVLERRLAASPLASFTGGARIGFYRDGVELHVRDGRLVEVRSWQPPLATVGVERGQPTTAERFAAAFPGLTFLQLVFGYRSLDELEYAFPDCLVRTDEIRALLLTLFPKQPSSVWPLL